MAKFTIQNPEVFTHLLDKFMALVPNKPSRDILKSIKLSCKQFGELDVDKQDYLLVQATDLETFLTYKLSACVKTTKEGNFVVPARVLVDYSKTLREEDPISVETTEETSVIKITSGSTQFEVAEQDMDEFPKFPEVPTINESDWINVPIDSFNDVLSKVDFAVADEGDPKYAFTAVCLLLEENSLTLMGSDSHRVSIGNVPITNIKTKKVLVTPKALVQIGKVFDTDFQLFLGENNIIAKADSVTLISRIVSGNYPDVKKIIPNHPNKITFNVPVLLGEVKKVSIAADKSQLVKVTIKSDKIILASKAREQRKTATVEIPISYEGAEVKLGINCQYLLDLLKAADKEEIEMQFNSSRTPVLFSQPGFKHVISLMET